MEDINIKNIYEIYILNGIFGNTNYCSEQQKI